MPGIVEKDKPLLYSRGLNKIFVEIDLVHSHRPPSPSFARRHWSVQIHMPWGASQGREGCPRARGWPPASAAPADQLLVGPLLGSIGQIHNSSNKTNMIEILRWKPLGRTW